MQKFELVLSNDKIKTYEKISWFVVAFNFCAFIYMGYILAGSEKARWPITGASLILIFIIFYLIRKRLKKARQFRFSFPLFFALFTWLQLKNYWFAAAILLLIIFEELAKKELIVKFSLEKILYPSFPKRTIKWQELNNVILKDGILTIDFKNNKLIQIHIIHNDIDHDLEEEMFNNFFKEQLNIKIHASS